MDAASLGPLFVPPWEGHGLSGLHGIPIALACLGIAITLFGLVRGKLSESAAFAGLAALPIAAYGFGMLLLLEDSKRLEFCGSCHVMGPLVASLQADDDTLASKHFAAGAIPAQEACYVCHSGYGIWGTIGAKRAGIGHMIRTLTGRYSLPIQLHGTFDIQSCLGCHAASPRFRKIEEHQPLDLQQELLSGVTGCTDPCHEEAHPEEALLGGEAAQ